MPLYEYECEKCGDVFEAIQKFSDEPLTTHEKCGGSVYRKISAPALQFKGSGWYITDYAKGSGSAAPNPENGGAAKKEGSGESSASESKSTKPGGGESAPAAASSESKSSTSDTK